MRDMIGEYVGLLFGQGDPLALYDAGDFFAWLEAESGERHYNDADVIHDLEGQLRDRIRSTLAGACDFCRGSGLVVVGEGNTRDTCDACDGTGEDVDADPTPLLVIGYADGEREAAVCVACGAQWRGGSKCLACLRRFAREDGDLIAVPS